MWSRLPFELEDRLCAEKTLRVRRTRYEGKSGRLIESVLDAVAPEHVDTNLDGKIPPRLNGHRGEGVNKVHGRIDRGLREPGEFREERIESLECPAWTATACDVGLQPEAWLAPEAREGIAGVGSHRPGTDITRSKASKLEYGFGIVVPGRRSTPHTRTDGLARLVSDTGVERRTLTNEAEIVDIDMESGDSADRHNGVHAPEDLPGKRLLRVAAVIENAALDDDRIRAEGIDPEGGRFIEDAPTVEAQADVRALAHVDQAARSEQHLLPAPSDGHACILTDRRLQVRKALHQVEVVDIGRRRRAGRGGQPIAKLYEGPEAVADMQVGVQQQAMQVIGRAALWRETEERIGEVLHALPKLAAEVDVAAG